MTALQAILDARGRTAYGTWVKLPTTESVEILALAGIDFVVLDMEHSPLDIGTVHVLLGVARGCGVTALVRVPDRTASTISRVLDSGAAGVLVPHVDTVRDAASVVAAARFPPQGSRGYGPTVRAGQWGGDSSTYRREAEEVLVIPQLESREAVVAARDIGAIDGVGALFVGPADLSVATGIADGSPEFAAMIRSAEDAAGEQRVPIGTAVGDAAAANELSDCYDFVLVGNDASLLRGATASMLDAVKNR